MSNTFMYIKVDKTIPVKEYLKFFEDNFKGDEEHCYGYIFNGSKGEGYYYLSDSIRRPENISLYWIKRYLAECPSLQPVLVTLECVTLGEIQ